ncbi:DoxX family protein [Virgibacillus ihumii]|uniref:DoxX family protein n=1 Tax=Virgibacillus ihumii TaxID=2686091 RepID=UPI00157BCA36|nr:DoxX family protein [Virgibacillus ihumii]
MLSTIIQIILAFMFFKAAVPKFTSNQQVEAFETYGYSQWFRNITAIVEVGTAFLLIIGIWKQQLAAIGGLLVLATMIGAIFTHIKLKDSFSNMVLSIALLVLGVIVLWQNSSALLG